MTKLVERSGRAQYRAKVKPAGVGEVIGSAWNDASCHRRWRRAVRDCADTMLTIVARRQYLSARPGEDLMIPESTVAA
jgi:hypothetical protein